MEKSVLFITRGKSFIASTLVKNLSKANYNIIEAEPRINETEDHIKEVDLIILFLGDFVGEISSFLVYLKDIATEYDKLVILVGNNDEIESAEDVIPTALVAASFPRPFDMKRLVDEADWLINANSDLAKRKSILLVDDDGAFLKMVKDWLSAKYNVTIVTSGAQALMYIADNTPDLILLDYEMPVISGPQVLEMIRSESKVDSIPVIFLTGKGDRESVMKVLALKPDGYLLKSTERNKLVSAIDDFFEKKKYKDLHEQNIQ